MSNHHGLFVEVPRKTSALFFGISLSGFHSPLYNKAGYGYFLQGGSVFFFGGGGTLNSHEIISETHMSERLHFQPFPVDWIPKKCYELVGG